MTVLQTQGLLLDIPDRDQHMPLDITVEPGQCWAVLGPNGSGKTTFLHTLAGLRTAASGTVLLDQQPLQGLSRRQLARHIGMLLQHHEDGFPATVEETVLAGRYPHLGFWQRETAEDYQQVDAAMDTMSVTPFRRRQVNTLSGGERQRVAVATILAQQPQIWLMDEPTNHLDLHHQMAVMALLAARAAQQQAVIMSLHDPNLAARWCDQVLLLYPDGSACWGPTKTMLVPAALEGLYQHPLRHIEVDGQSVFLPK